MEKIWKRLRPFRLSPQRPVSATRSSDRELRPRSPAVLAGVQTKHGVLFVEGGPSTQPYARGPLRPPRDISMPRARARATPNARARLVHLHLCLTHSLWLRAAVAGSNEPPPPSRLAPQAGPSLSPPASSRRRLARSRPRPASSRRRLASRRAFALLASCQRRQPVLALETTRQAGKRSGYRTLRARSSNHSTAGPS